MDFDRATVDVLAPAVAAGRAALRRLDEEEIPARVARVARTGDGRLPPPLVLSLLKALDDDESLREKAAAEAPESGPADLFLRRPDGWEEELAVIAGGRQTRVADTRDHRAEQRATAAERQLRAANQKIEELRRRVREVEHREVELRSSTHEAVRTATESAQAEARSARREADVLGEQLAASKERADDLERRLDVLREELLQERRSREPAGAAQGPVGTWSGDGARLAEHIDDTYRAARARIDSSGSERPIGPVGELDGDATDPRSPLPLGVLPDQAEAIDALIGWQGTVYIDGYNLSAELGVSPSKPGEGRDRVRQVVNRITARGTRGPEVVVVYDTTQGSEERKGQVFVPDADAELRRLAAIDPLRTVVVSDDREVIDGVHAAGATAVWADAVVDWIRQRR